MGSNPNPNAKKRPIAKAIRRFLAEDEGFEFAKESPLVAK